MIREIKVDEEILLKPIAKEDSEIIFNAIDSNRPHLRKWLPFIDMTKTPKDTLSFIESISNDLERRQIVLTVWRNNEFAGLLGLKDIDYLNSKIEIGYWMVEKMTGSGTMTKSVECLITYVFKELQMNRVQIKCGVGNDKSSAIPRRLGFSFEGIERAGEKHQHKFIDLEVFSILEKEWES